MGYHHSVPTRLDDETQNPYCSELEMLQQPTPSWLAISCRHPGWPAPRCIAVVSRTSTSQCG